MSEVGATGRVEEDVLVSNLVNDLAPAIEAAKAGKELTLKVDLEHAPQTIHISRRPLRSILSNLVLNAIKFTERGSVTVRISSAPARGAEPGVVLEVTDTGLRDEPGADQAWRRSRSRNFRRPARANIAAWAWGSQWFIATSRRSAASSKSARLRAAARASSCASRRPRWLKRAREKWAKEYLAAAAEPSTPMRPRRFSRRHRRPAKPMALLPAGSCSSDGLNCRFPGPQGPSLLNKANGRSSTTDRDGAGQSRTEREKDGRRSVGARAQCWGRTREKPR